MKHLLSNKPGFFLLYLFLLMLIPGGCDEDEEYIPWVEVKLSIDLSLHNGLKVPSYSMKFDEAGFSGVIVLCYYYDNIAPAQSVYYAFDATCTYEISQDCSLTVDDNGIFAVCPCCGSKYSLLGGYPVEGLATKGLKTYNVRLNGEKLWVYN